MKQDRNLMRLIMLEVRDEQPPPELKKYDEPMVLYHSALLVDEDYIDGEVVWDGSGDVALTRLRHLTMKGNELLESLEAESNLHGQGQNTMNGINETCQLEVFISHSAKDEKLALALIELLRNALNIPAEKIRCTSVDGFRLQAGAPTDATLRQEIRESKEFIGLITPVSRESAYVMFELGARWGAELHLVPLLGAGADMNCLPAPLKTLNTLNCGNAGQVHQLVDDISKHLGIKERTPASAYHDYVDRLVAASKSS